MLAAPLVIRQRLGTLRTRPSPTEQDYRRSLTGSHRFEVAVLPRHDQTVSLALVDISDAACSLCRRQERTAIFPAQILVDERPDNRDGLSRLP